MYLQKVISKKINFCWHLEDHWRKEQDPEPDPLVKSTDPRIRIRTKMSRIRNTDFNCCGITCLCTRGQWPAGCSERPCRMICKDRIPLSCQKINIKKGFIIPAYLIGLHNSTKEKYYAPTIYHWNLLSWITFEVMWCKNLSIKVVRGVHAW